MTGSRTDSLQNTEVVSGLLNHYLCHSSDPMPKFIDFCSPLVFEPEARLWTIYIGEILMVPGLIGVGQALENHAHWAVLAVSWGLYVTGTIIVR